MIVRLATQAMATSFEVVLAGDDEARLRAAGAAALEEVREQERLLSRFRRDSLVAHLGREAHARPVRVDADTFALLADCEAVRAASGGAFDVATPGGPGALVLDRLAHTVRFAAPQALDLGAVGKGHALDLAADVLRELGVARALLHGGTSTAVAIGRPRGADGWRVQVPGGAEVLLADRALSVSAARLNGDRAGELHVLDPRSGARATCGDPVAVTAPTARLADAWSTALLVLRAAGDALPPERSFRIVA